MSVKRRVLLLSIIFIALGISVSAILIAIGGGFSRSRSSGFNPPTQADLWAVGNTQINEFDLQYIVTSTVIDGAIQFYGVLLNFSKLDNSNWNVSVSIRNDTFSRFAILLSQND